MFSKLSIVASLALIPFAAAQGANDFGIQLEAIVAHFEQSHLVPDLLETFDPSALLTINYEGVGDLTPGQPLSNEQTGTTPRVTITGPEGTEFNGNYTIAMVDPGHVGADTSAGVTRHWLVNGVTVDGSGVVSAEGATVITAHAGPFPPEGDGPHRYTVLLYQQPENFAAPEGFTSTLEVGLMDFGAYVRNSGLGDLVAGNYYTVERGELSSSLPATSAVDTATLSAPASSGSGSGASSGASTSTGSGAAPSTTGSGNTGAASALTVSPLLALAGAVMMFVA